MSKAKELLSILEVVAKKLVLTPDEESKLFQAMRRTWEEIASDAQQLGCNNAGSAIELVLDRIGSIGNLDRKIIDKVFAADYKLVDKYLVANKGKWY